jgi:hypothetical protein
MGKFNWSNAGPGAATGVVSGAATGTAIMPGWGTVIGGIGGGLLGGIGGGLPGGGSRSSRSRGSRLAGTGQNPFMDSKDPSGFRSGYLQQYTPEQMQLFQQQFGNVGPDSYLAQLAGGDEEAFAEMEAPAWQNLSRAQGQLGSRYSGMGTGAQKSSGFRNEQGQLGADFAQQLAAKRADYRRQALTDLMGFSNQLLGQRPYERYLVEKGPSSAEKAMNMWGPLAQTGITAAGQYFGSRGSSGGGGSSGGSSYSALSNPVAWR